MKRKLTDQEEADILRAIRARRQDGDKLLCERYGVTRETLRVAAKRAAKREADLGKLQICNGLVSL